MNLQSGIQRSEFTKYAFVALGSNQGRSQEAILAAISHARFLTDHPVLQSSLWETTPVACPPDSPKFLNSVVAFIPKKNETPESLLKKLQELEKAFGRVPKKVLNEPRPLDLDLITFGAETRNAPDLILPHPRAHLRRFVLQPLCEIAPELILPGQGKTVAELLAELQSDEGLRKI